VTGNIEREHVRPRVDLERRSVEPVRKDRAVDSNANVDDIVSRCVPRFEYETRLRPFEVIEAPRAIVAHNLRTRQSRAPVQKLACSSEASSAA
jgi:hypothetical protein